MFFLAFDLCRFCVVIRFFHPRHNSQWPPTSKDFYTKSYPLHYFLILILEKEPVFHWYHFYNVFGMTRSLTGDFASKTNLQFRPFYLALNGDLLSRTVIFCSELTFRSPIAACVVYLYVVSISWSCCIQSKLVVLFCSVVFYPFGQYIVILFVFLCRIW